MDLLKIYTENNVNNKLWIYSSSDYESIISILKIVNYLINILKVDKNDIGIIYENSIIIKIDTDGLSIYVNNIKVKNPKVVLCRIHSGELVVDYHITILRQLELMGSLIVNNIDSIMKSTNKLWHLQDLSYHNIPIATTMSICSKDIDKYSNVDDTLKYPIIMKMSRGNRGNQVFQVYSITNQEELYGVINKDYPYLFQEYISESHGRDLRVVVVENKVVFSIIRKSTSGSVRANLNQGGSGEDVTGQYQDAEELAIKICKILKLDICGVDFLFSNKYGYICCEVNSAVGFTKSKYKDYCIERAISEFLYKKMNE